MMHNHGEILDSATVAVKPQTIDAEHSSRADLVLNDHLLPEGA